uniref:Protein kinase domain-containing protein n=1 Tax=Oryzias melastigma TaxID=30732 RepID=A0A3B3BVP6_ORYME
VNCRCPELTGGGSSRVKSFIRPGRRMSDHKFEVEVNSLLPSDCALYLVEKFLGEGTFGKVAKCRDLTTNQEVAIKITKPSHRDSGLFELNALAEITKLDADKYCLIKFLDWFEYRSHICIVYEMLDQSLHDFMNIREHRPLLIHEIRTIARELLISLKGLKEINMAHRDIKPDNIMLVNQASEPFRVKLIDFGLAINPTDMETGTFMQNLRYRAPEVILGLPLDEHNGLFTESRCCLSYNDLKNFYQDKTKTREVKMFIKLLRRMLEIDPNKQIEFPPLFWYFLTYIHHISIWTEQEWFKYNK